MKEIFYNTGLVIKTTPYRDSSVICNLLTKNGMCAQQIKGVRKENSRTLKYATPLTLISYTTEFDTLLGHTNSTFKDATIVDNLTNLKLDVVKYQYASIILECLNTFGESVEFPLIYDFSVFMLQLLNKSSYEKEIITIYLLKLLYLQGVGFNFKKCPKCGKNLGQFSLKVSSGNAFCLNCEPYGLSLHNALMLKKMYLVKYQSLNDELLSSFKVDAELEKYIDDYYLYHLEFKSQAKRVIRQLGE